MTRTNGASASPPKRSQPWSASLRKSTEESDWERDDQPKGRARPLALGRSGGQEKEGTEISSRFRKDSSQANTLSPLIEPYPRELNELAAFAITFERSQAPPVTSALSVVQINSPTFPKPSSRFRAYGAFSGPPQESHPTPDPPTLRSQPRSGPLDLNDRAD